MDIAKSPRQTSIVAIDAAYRCGAALYRCGWRANRSEGQALGSIIDLHTHTTVGSSDSVTTPADFTAIRDRLPSLDGVALTEHVFHWPDEALAELPGDFLAFNEREYDTYQGHIIVIGVSTRFHVSSVEELRDRVLDKGGLMILAHPFRFYPSPLSLLYPRAWHEPGEWPPERLAEHSLFQLVDAVEAWNYRALPAQNELAAECARIHGLPIVAGSDSHAPEDVGRFATEFEDHIRTQEQLMAAIRTGRCHPVELTPGGVYRRQKWTQERQLVESTAG